MLDRELSILGVAPDAIDPRRLETTLANFKLESLDRLHAEIGLGNRLGPIIARNLVQDQREPDASTKRRRRSEGSEPAGESGTARRLANGQRDPARGRAQVKTGTLRDVSGIAGYVTTGSGARYVVVGFINHPEAGKGRPALEALLNWTADLP
jgi:(p)ppGpp synthase/HD superfamily hydrolase